MSEILKHAPIFYAVCEIGWNSEAGKPAANDVASILGAAVHGENLDAVVYSDLGQPLRLENSSFEVLSTKEGAWVVGPDFMRFHTAQYVGRRLFFDCLLRGWSALQIQLQNPRGVYVGMRYLDAIFDDTGIGLDSYVIEGLRGIPGSSDFFATQTLMTPETPMGPVKLVVQTHRSFGRVGYPDGLHPWGITLSAVHDRDESEFIVLDTDVRLEGSFSLMPDVLENTLSALHEQVRAVFDTVTTEKGRAQWR